MENQNNGRKSPPNGDFLQDIISWVKFGVRAYESVMAIYKEEFKHKESEKGNDFRHTDSTTSDGDDYIPFVEVDDTKTSEHDTDETKRNVESGSSES